MDLEEELQQLRDSEITDGSKMISMASAWVPWLR